MVGKVSDRVLAKEGLERTDNGMKQTSWPEATPINQKNYYTDYMKRDDQLMSVRIQTEAARDTLVQNAKDRDRALAMMPEAVAELPAEDGAAPSVDDDPTKIIVIHPGSQNFRIGLASDALPKSIPMVIGIKHPQTEADSGDALPQRKSWAKDQDQAYGEEWSKKYAKMSNDLKADMRANKRKVLPNSKDLVINYNRRTEPEFIPEHNDPVEIAWTDPKSLQDPGSSASSFLGQEALRLPDDSDPKFRLYWPLRLGWFNEEDYGDRNHLFNDIDYFIEQALRRELGLTSSVEWENYSVVFVIPDLYDKKYVEEILHICLESLEFKKISFIQESLAATFGAGYSSACVVDVGAQKTSISCVEDGMVIEDSRINLKYGGFDVTETFVKMMLYDKFPYQEINLRRRHDFLLAEELKQKHCTLSQADISVQLYNFHVRAHKQATRKYQFKTYDEVILAPMGFYEPSIFDNSNKIRSRRRLVPRSYNVYDVDIPDDPVSAAQTAILALIQPSVIPTANGFTPSADVATPSKEKPQPSFSFLSRGETNGTPATSNAPSPAPEGASTPVPPPFAFGGARENGGSPAPSGRNGGTPAPTTNGAATNGTNGAKSGDFSLQPPPGMFVDPNFRSQKAIAAERDAILPIAPLDIAILTSIQNAAKGDDKKVRDLAGGVMVIGGGSKLAHFGTHLEERLKARRPDLAERIMVSRSARDMDEQVVVWKGASVFAKLSTNDSWITTAEYERLGARTLYNKCLWHY